MEGGNICQNRTVVVSYNIRSKFGTTLHHVSFISNAQGENLLQLDAVPNPLRRDDSGAIFIGASRVTLDLIVELYENGQAPEDMVRGYDTLELAEVHAAIAYYLRNRNEVLAYLQKRSNAADKLRATIEALRPRLPRDELSSRK